VRPSQCEDSVSQRSKAWGKDDVVESRATEDAGGGGGRGGAAVEGPACEEPAPEGRLACWTGGGLLDSALGIGAD
jgi:hypothetical protein